MRYVAVLAGIGLLLAATAMAGATTTVVEGITGAAGDWTYTYTLTNDEALPIWQWAVWFPSNPVADTVTAGTANWAATDLVFQGFFPAESIAAGYDVRDSSGNVLAGPNGEPGSLNTYASDFTSANAGEYWNGAAWVALPDPLPAWTDPVWDAKWRGEDYGWEGPGANIVTAHGIPSGGTGQFTVHSATALPVGGPKSFSFNTTDYWYSMLDPQGTADLADDVLYVDFEGSGDVIPEPVTMAGLMLGIGCLARYVRRRKV